MSVKSVDYFAFYRKRNEQMRNKFISIIKHDQIKQKVYFEFCNQEPHHLLLFQRLAFYEPAVIQRYGHNVESASAVHIVKQNRSIPVYKNVLKQFLNKKKPKLIFALLKDNGLLHTLYSSHPRYGIYSYSISKDGVYISTTHEYYRDKQYKHLMLKSKRTFQIIAVDKAKKINKKRTNKLNNTQQVEENYKLCLPHLVGKKLQKHVFLSDLYFDATVNEIYCNGCGSMDRMMSNHGWFIGTGDHINAQHISDIVYQFCNLIVKNGKNDKHKLLYSFFVESNKLKYFNDECNITLFDWKYEFKKFVELRNFKVYLHELRMDTTDGNEVDTNILQKFHAAFKFYVKIGIVQYGNECCTVTAGVCPTLLLSHL